MIQNNHVIKQQAKDQFRIEAVTACRQQLKTNCATFCREKEL